MRAVYAFTQRWGIIYCRQQQKNASSRGKQKLNRLKLRILEHFNVLSVKRIS